MRAREICLPWNEPLLTLGMPGAEGWAVRALEMAFSAIGGCTQGAAWERGSEDKINMANDWLEVGGLQEG